MELKHDKPLDVAAAFTVYKHTSPSGKVYIGITRNQPKRRWKGGHGYTTNFHFFRAIQQHGWDAFRHEIIAEGLTEAQAQQMERDLIALYDSTNPGKGYNRDPGGGVRSAETSAKISAALTGVPLSAERRRRMSEQRTGKSLTATHRAKISESHKTNPLVQAHIQELNKARAGLHQTEEHRRKIAESQPRRRMVKNLDTGEVFASISEAAQKYGGHPCIVKACTGERKTAYGFRWAYEEAEQWK